MELTVFLRTILRRWYLTLTVLALTGLLATLAVLRVGATYEAQGSVLIFPPTETSMVDGERRLEGNPFLDLDGVSQARDIVIRSITSKDSRDDLAEMFPRTEFEATPDFTNGAPIVLITVESGDDEEAVAALTELVDRVPRTLVRLQRGLDLAEDAVITSVPLTFDERPETLHKSQIRVALAVGAVTLGAGLLLVGLLDGFLRARRRRRHARGPGDAPQHSDAAPLPEPPVSAPVEKTPGDREHESVARTR